MGKVMDLIGEKYGRLTVLKRIPQDHGHTIYECLCECGKITMVRQGKIRSGRTKSCGCLRTEMKTRHGLSYHPCYGVWNNMVSRCYNKKDIGYNNYGGRGVSVCSMWKESPTLFIQWLLGNGWEKGLQIDRKNNNGNYCPNNCRVVTPTENNNNSRRNHVVIIHGEQLTMAEAERKYGLKKGIIKKRFSYGWRGDDLVLPKQNRWNNVRGLR